MKGKFESGNRTHKTKYPQRKSQRSKHTRLLLTLHDTATCMIHVMHSIFVMKETPNEAKRVCMYLKNVFYNIQCAVAVVLFEG